jgi:hypothetical protein
MDMNQLKTILQNSLSDEGFIIDIEKLQSSAIDGISQELFKISEDFFPDGKLKLTVDSSESAIEVSPKGDSASIKGKGEDYPFNGMDVTAVFSMEEDGVGLKMVATGDENWIFTDSFPPLEGTIVDHMKFVKDEKPSITLSSHKNGDIPQGMHFDGVVDLKAMSEGLSNLLNIPNQNITGTVVICDNGSNFQSIDFDGTDVQGVNLGIATDCEVGFQIGCQLIPNIKENDDTAIPYIGMTTTIPFITKGIKQDLKVCVQVSNFNMPIRFSIDLNESIDAAVEELKVLTAGSGFDRLLPSDFKLGEYVTFDDLFFDYSLDRNTVEFISMGVSNASQWTIAQISGTDKALVMEKLALRLMINNPFGMKNDAVSIEGEVAITDSGVMCLYGKCPNWEIGGYLKKDSVLSVKDLASFFIGESNSVPDILIDIIDFKLSSGDYTLDARLKELWSITERESVVFAIDEVLLSIEYNTAKGTIAKFKGILDIAGIQVNLEADYGASEGFSFIGSTGEGQDIHIDRLIKDIESRFGHMTLPAVLEDFIEELIIENLSISFNTATKDFTFSCRINFPISSTSTAYLTVEIDLTHKDDGTYDNRFSGTLNIGELLFDVKFDWTKDTSALVALYINTKEDSISINSLIANVSKEFSEILPTVDIGLKDVLFAWSKSEKASKYLFAMDISAEVGLSNIPLIGKDFPSDETVKVNNLKMLILSEQINRKEVDTINSMINIDWAKLPKAENQSNDGSESDEEKEVAIDSGATFTADMQFGSKIEILNLNIGGAGQKADPAENKQVDQIEKEGSDSTALVEGNSQSESKAKWFKLQKSFGPVYFERIGVSYEDNCLCFLLDGSLSLGGLTISLTGMSIGSPLNNFKPQFYLQGIGIDFQQAPIDIGGSFLAVEPPQPGVNFQYDGNAIIQMGKFSIAAMGSYAQLENGNPSMFVFANALGNFGGPPIAFVNGIAAGFGYNRDIEVPAYDEVFSFPLMALMEGDSKDMPITDMLDMLEGRKSDSQGKVNVWIKPSAGEYWLAAGVKLTSYELIYTRALLLAKFGNELEIAVMGLSTMALPTNSSDYKFANVGLQIEADWKPSEGFFGLSAVLTTDSFIFDKNCHLTGGAAIFIWYEGDKKGQFVFTIGGYHSKFNAPSYYPKLQRLGFNWIVSDSVQIVGNSYFAITPAAVMAGGLLEVLFNAGSLSANFSAQADLLITFNPFYFIADISISASISVRIPLFFITKTLTVELGASLSLWGPPTGGIVYFHWWVISFSVGFGDNEKGNSNAPISWEDFKPLLPALESACSIQANNGLSGVIDDNVSDNKVWVVRAHKFSFSTCSAIPCSQFEYKGAADLLKDNQPYNVNIRSMNKVGIRSSHRFKLCNDYGELDISAWNITVSYENIPSALWGLPLKDGNGNFVLNPNVPDNRTVNNVPVGLKVTVPQSTIGYSAGEMSFELLQYADINPQGVLPLEKTNPSADYIPVASETTAGAIEKAAQASQIERRTNIYNVLNKMGVYSGSNDSMESLAKNAGNLYWDSPLQL